MPKYRFDDLKLLGVKLPADVNEPIAVLLKKHYAEFPEIIDRLHECERRKAKGPFIIAEPGTARTVNAKMQYGMISGIDCFETYNYGERNGKNVTLVIGTHIPNSNIIMPKRNERKENG